MRWRKRLLRRAMKLPGRKRGKPLSKALPKATMLRKERRVPKKQKKVQPKKLLVRASPLRKNRLRKTMESWKKKLTAVISSSEGGTNSDPEADDGLRAGKAKAWRSVGPLQLRVEQPTLGFTKVGINVLGKILCL